MNSFPRRFVLHVVVGAVVLSVAFATALTAQSRDPKDGLRGRPESQPTAFAAYVNNLTYGTAPGSKRFDGDIPCANVSKCSNQSAVSFVITPSDYVDDWDGALKGTKNGHIVAKIFKLGGVSFDYWNLNADDNFSYLWVGQQQDGPGAALYAMRNGKLTRIYKFASVKQCSKAAGPPEVHMNMPAQCKDPIGALPSGSAELPVGQFRLASLSSQNLIASRFRVQGTGLGGVWISCSGGCCEVQYGL